MPLLSIKTSQLHASIIQQKAGICSLLCEFPDSCCTKMSILKRYTHTTNAKAHTMTTTMNHQQGVVFHNILLAKCTHKGDNLYTSANQERLNRITSSFVAIFGLCVYSNVCEHGTTLSNNLNEEKSLAKIHKIKTQHTKPIRVVYSLSLTIFHSQARGCVLNDFHAQYHVGTHTHIQPLTFANTPKGLPYVTVWAHKYVFGVGFSS